MNCAKRIRLKFILPNRLTVPSLIVALALLGLAGCQGERAVIAKGNSVHTKEQIEQFSEKPVRVLLGAHEFMIPRNYFSPFGRSSRDERVVDTFGFRLFLPDYNGFTLDNLNYYPWASGRVKDFIAVITVSAPSKFEIRDGKRVEFKPNQWGEPNALFDLSMSSGYQLAHEDYGLKCYGGRAATGVFYNTLCKGVRSNGELLVMHTSEEGEGKSLYRCMVRYYSEQEQLYVQYNFSRDKLHLWKAIDDAIWAKLHSWRVR